MGQFKKAVIAYLGVFIAWTHCMDAKVPLVTRTQPLQITTFTSEFPFARVDNKIRH